MLLWFFLLRRLLMCSTLAKVFSWALWLAQDTECCTELLHSDGSFNSVSWLLLLWVENKVSVCHSCSVWEDELGDKSHGEADRAEASWTKWGHSPMVEKQSGSGESNRVIQESRSLDIPTVKKHIWDQDKKSRQCIGVLPRSQTYKDRHGHDNRSKDKGLSLSAAPAEGDRPLLVRAFFHTVLSTQLSDSRLHSWTVEADCELRHSDPWMLKALT